MFPELPLKALFLLNQLSDFGELLTFFLMEAINEALILA
jgi:hypothetical protein